MRDPDRPDKGRRNFKYPCAVPVNPKNARDLVAPPTAEEVFLKKRDRLVEDLMALLLLRHRSTPARFNYYGDALQVWDATDADRKLVESAKRENPRRFEQAQVKRLFFHNVVVQQA